MDTTSSHSASEGMNSAYRELNQCRVCGSHDLFPYLDLGNMPLVNSYVDKQDGDQKDPRFPLKINFCTHCATSQLSIVVDPKIMFKNYFYRSSISKTFMDHCRDYARHVTKRFEMNSEDLVIDIASNDGAALSMFKKFGVRVLGVDPAENLAAIAEKKGIETHPDFWSPDVAKMLKDKHGPAKFVTGSNVFAHVDDVSSFLKGVTTILSEDGVFAIEVPYAATFLENTEFDTTYHEHLSYFLLKPLIQLFAQVGLEVFDVQSFKIHGGTIRVYAKRKGCQKYQVEHENIDSFLDHEMELGLHDKSAYMQFSRQVADIKKNLSELLRDLKAKGKTVAAYGASAKGNVLMNYCELDSEMIDFIVDDTPEKQGYLSPGNHIPIVPASMIAERRPDYLLLLAWNFSKELMAKTRSYQEAGGRYIVPIPELKVI